MNKNLLALLLSSALLAACGPAAGPAGGAAPGAGMPPPQVDVITAGTASATLTQDLPGRVQAVRTAQIRARVEGVIEKRLFTEGSDVKAGTRLFTIDARTYKAAVESARADVAVAKTTVDRYTPLLAVKAVSQQEFDAAQAKLKQAEATLAKAELDYENASVPAPISGRIGRALVTEGALVGKSEATQLAVIEQLDPVYVTFTQSGAELLRLKQAVQAGKLRAANEAKVQLLMEDGSNYANPGKLNFADLATDPDTGAVTLRAEFPNPRRDLLPGMFVRVRFPQGTLDNAIKVPQKAVQLSQTGHFVMVVGPENKAVAQPVKVGAMAGTDWVINEGLKGGEQVIVNGLQKVKPGAPVTPQPLAGAAAVGSPAPAAKQGS